MKIQYAPDFSSVHMKHELGDINSGTCNSRQILRFSTGTKIRIEIHLG